MNEMIIDMNYVETISLLMDFSEVGFTKEELNNDNECVVEAAQTYFEFICEHVLELDEVKYEFTENEASFLRMNEFTVNPKAIIKGE